jgi:hypothetical protein
MGHAGRRFGAGLLFATVLAGIAAIGACSLKPTAGGKCTTNGKYSCSDPSSAMLCQDNVYVSIPCRGPHGCVGTGGGSQCDDDLAQVGDACMMTLNQNYACSTDHKKELICQSGKFAEVRSCKGPKACTVMGETLHCDDSLADMGDPCVEEPGDANYACSTDKLMEVVCKSSKFEQSNSCRGTKGCWIQGESVHCDNTFAREGEICRPVDDYSCSEDATALMRCSPQMKWAKKRDCKRDGCKIKGHEVICG